MLTQVQAGAIFTTQPIAFVADYDTSPPEGQVIKTDPTSLLIRNLQNRKAKEEAKKKQKAAGKRPAEEADAGRQVKRGGATGAPAGEEAAGPSGAAPSPSSKYTRASLQSKNVKDLQAILRTLGLTISGKKEDLIARILDQK